MSIALAILSNGGLVVASDGRRFHNGQYASDCFDKTFCISNKKIIGAYTGVLSFNTKTVEEHINEIIADKCSDASYLGSMIEALCNRFTKRMESIDADEVGYQNRKTDILLADRRTIYGICFRPDNDNNIIRANINTYDGAGAYCACGSDDAKTAALNVVAAQKSQIPSMRAKSFRNLARRAIRKGIESAGPSLGYEQIPSCGGRIYLRSI